MTIPGFSTYLAAAALLCPALHAADMQMKAQRVSLFKNGYACVQMSGSLPEGTAIQVRNLPLPIFGTDEWYAPEGVDIALLKARLNKTPETTQQDFWLRTVYESVGREASVVVRQGDKWITYRGTIVAPMLPDTPPEGAFLRQTNTAPAPTAAPTNAVLLLRTAHGGLTSVRCRDIHSIDFPEPTTPPAQEQEGAELTLQLKQPAPGQTIEMRCLAYGLSWLPTYHLNLVASDKAQLVGRVTIINEMLDLDSVQLELITGFPALGDAIITSPMVRLVNLRAFLAAIERNTDWYPSYTMLNRSAHDGYRSASSRRSYSLAEVDGMWAEEDSVCEADTGFGGVAPSGPSRWDRGSAANSGESSTQAEDLFYYSIPNVTCRQGDVIERDLFTLDIPCRHVYTCDVPNQTELQSSSNSDEPQAYVWHCVRLTNTGSLPWSTGTLASYKDDRLAARSLLNYTAPGQDCLVQLNKTAEAEVSCHEELTQRGTRSSNRRKKAAIADVYTGKILLSNNSDRPMEMELTKHIIGTPTQVSDEGQCDVTPTYGDNPRSTIKWKLTLDPGQKKTVIYTYNYGNH